MIDVGILDANIEGYFMYFTMVEVHVFLICTDRLLVVNIPLYQLLSDSIDWMWYSVMMTSLPN